MILAGDIGGTKTNLALFDKHLRSVVQKTYLSREHAGPYEMIRHFASETGMRFRLACFGVAGPVRDGRCKTTNLPWVVDARQLSVELGIPKVGLINDLEANAYGIAALRKEDFAVLSEGIPDSRGNAALIAAGTGLGEAGLYWDGERHRPFATEGGHSSFSPRNKLEAELLLYLLRDFDPVSWENVLSGGGLHNIYRFLRDTHRGEEPPWLGERIRGGDPAAAISQAALEGTSSLCADSLDLFVSLYGAEAGNLALKTMATGGVFLGGGVAPKILVRLDEPHFLRSFVEKGPMSPLLRAMPVRVILNERAAVIGAARYAALSDSP